MAWCSDCCRTTPAIEGATEVALGGGQKPFLSRNKARALLALSVMLLLLPLIEWAACALLNGVETEMFGATGTARPKADVLEGEFDRHPGLTWYLGGFCFRATNDAKDADGLKVHAGMLNLTLGSAGDDILRPDVFAAVEDMHLLLFDDQPQHWAAMRETGMGASCQELKATASVAIPLAFNNPAVAYINQHFMARHWYALLVDCAPQDVHGAKSETLDRLSYRLRASDALRAWGTDELDPADCPQDFWKVATQKIGTIFA